MVQLSIGLWIGIMPREPQNHAFLLNLLIFHLATGTTIFILMIIRAVLRRQLGAPAPAPDTPYDAALLARINHYGFYFLLLLLPIIGWFSVSSHSLAQRPHFGGSLHGGLALTLLLAIGAHLAGVIYHTAIRHDGVLRRMTR